jgi:hypothetical protein
MQTFLPHDDFRKSAKCLDKKRLMKQRVETTQILRALCGVKKGWNNHPATKMWKGHEGALAEYGWAIHEECCERSVADNTGAGANFYLFMDDFGNTDPPDWLSNEEFHASHRSNLLRKDPEWYGQFGWEEPDDLEYVWPV